MVGEKFTKIFELENFAVYCSNAVDVRWTTLL